MPLEFLRPVDKLEIWSASRDGFSFVISFEDRVGPGFHGPAGYIATWRPLYQSNGAIRIGGSPFQTLAEAEAACDKVVEHLIALDDHSSSRSTT